MMDGWENVTIQRAKASYTQPSHIPGITRLLKYFFATEEATKNPDQGWLQLVCVLPDARLDRASELISASLWQATQALPVGEIWFRDSFVHSLSTKGLVYMRHCSRCCIYSPA